jgi:hypothetical protein
MASSMEEENNYGKMGASMRAFGRITKPMAMGG